MTSARPSRLAWAVGAAFGLWHYLMLLVGARMRPVERFDGGILSSTVTFLSHGQLPYSDFYEPYGVGFGAIGLVPRALGADGLFAERVTYAVLGALCTALAVVVVWRRCGAPVAVVVGLLTLPAEVARYSGSLAAVFGFVLVVDHAWRRWRARAGEDAVREGGLGALAAAEPRLLALAAFVLSLAGWIRMEYAVFGLIWAAFVAVASWRRPGWWRLPALTALTAMLPVLLVIATGGLRGLWWWASYALSRGPTGFDAQRGQDVDWSLFADRLRELLHVHLRSGEPGKVFSGYGLAAAVVAGALVLVAVPAGRRRLLADRTLVTPFLAVLSAIVLFGQLARFSGTYAVIALPLFAVAAALLAGRVDWRVLVPFALVVVWPVVIPAATPGALRDAYDARPQWRDRETIPRLNRIAVQPNGTEGPMLAALPKAWKALGLEGRPVLSVGRHNDLAWGNDAIVGYLLDAPSAAWPLTYDPGLANSDRVQERAVSELCANRAPVVQLAGDYPGPAGVDPVDGSRRLDAFLAANYRLAATAGEYRVLTASGACVRPEGQPTRALQALRDGLVQEGDLPAAGAIASLLVDRARAAGGIAGADDVAVAALGGYRLRAGDDPGAALAPAVRSLADGQPRPGLAALAARRWPSDLQALAAQAAWIQHGQGVAGEDAAAASAAVLAMARRHPSQPSALADVAILYPPTPELVRELAAKGARGIPDFDRWRYGYAQSQGQGAAALRAGLDLVADLVRRRDLIAAGKVELELATVPGLGEGCALALRRRADGRDGVYAPTAPGGPACADARITRAP